MPADLLASVQTAADTAPVNGWLVLVLVVGLSVIAAIFIVREGLWHLDRADEPTVPRRLTGGSTRLPRATHNPLTCDCKDVR